MKITSQYSVIALMLLSCGTERGNESSSALKKGKDSLLRARIDSVRAIETARLAHLNRPWKTNTFVDNFGDPTFDKYVETRTEGVFSNSATKNSYLFVEIIVTKNAAGIFLHEYDRGSPPQKFIGSAQIQMKNSAGKTIIINTSREWNQQGGIKIENWADIGEYDFSKFRNFLKQSSVTVKVVIFDDYSSSYQFQIDITGFTQELNGL